MEFTQEEYLALAGYQDKDYKVINSLLRQGFNSEKTIDERKGKGYPYLTKDAMDGYLSCIGYIYSAILKGYQSNGCESPSKTIYRGTQIEIVEAMDKEECSFLSTTTSYAQTRCFSMLYHKDGSKDDSKRAIAVIEGNVPWINIDDVMGGMENEIIFVPAKVSVEPADYNIDTKLGKTYKITLSELDISPKTPEEITEMRNTILDKTETMSDYLKLILASRTNLSLQNTPQLEFATQEYNKWKELVVEYNHQQYRVLKNTIINQANLEDKKNISPK